MINDKELRQAAAYLRAGTEGMINFGGLLSRWAAQGADMNEAERRLAQLGVEFPSKGRRSVYKTVYESWCDVSGAGVNPTAVMYHEDFTDKEGNAIPMTMTGVAVDKLWHLRHDVRSDNAAELLAWAYTHNEKQHRLRNKLAAEGVPEEQREERVQEIDVKSFSLNKGSYDLFLSLLDRLRSVTGDPHISRVQAFDFMVQQFSPDDMTDASLNYLWRAAHGEVGEEEVEAAENIEWDIQE